VFKRKQFQLEKSLVENEDAYETEKSFSASRLIYRVSCERLPTSWFVSCECLVFKRKQRISNKKIKEG